MAANLTPQYHEAEARYRAATTPEEKLAALEEMWRQLPKHKSSEKLQADLKKKISSTRKALQQGGRKGATRADPFAIPHSGAGQVTLTGTPNTGKSSIVGGLTHAQVTVADYPFSTPLPVPGMMPFEDIQIQLVDTPPVTADHVPPGLPGLWRTTDALLVVADLASDTLLEDSETCLSLLADRHLQLTDRREPVPDAPGELLPVPGLIIANKADTPNAPETLPLLRESVAERARIEPLSTRDPEQMARLPGICFELVGVIRVYAKPPGKRPDLTDPFILPIGGDVHALARKVYRGLEHRLRSARLWGFGVNDGQQVHLDHVLHDRDIVELHM